MRYLQYGIDVSDVTFRQIVKFILMHNKVDELKIKHPNLNIIECVELVYIELKRKYEEEIELNEQSILN